MIQEIAIVIGLYVILRALSFLTREGDRKENLVVKIMAAITMIVTGLILTDIVFRGTELSQNVSSILDRLTK